MISININGVNDIEEITQMPIDDWTDQHLLTMRSVRDEYGSTLDGK